MMTAGDYIRKKFQGFGVSLSDSDLLDLCLDAKTSEGDEVDWENRERISVAVARFIPSLLLRASSVSENGFSMSWDTQGIRDYYSLLCKQYGLEDKLSSKPKVTFL